MLICSSTNTNDSIFMYPVFMNRLPSYDIEKVYRLLMYLNHDAHDKFIHLVHKLNKCHR